MSTANLHPFFIAAGLLAMTLCIQYLIVWWRASNHDDQMIAKVFTGILAIRTIGLLGGGLLPPMIGIWVASICVVISWIAPGLTGRYTRKHPIIFSHLLERLNGLTIVLFGETIVGIAGFFTESTLAFTSILIFTIVSMLFLAYVMEFDRLIEPNRRGETGNRLIYLHYPIIFGVSMINVAMEFVMNQNADHAFAVSFLYVGLILFSCGIWLAQRYNKQGFQNNANYSWVYMALMIGGWLITIALPQPLAVLGITAAATIVGNVIMLKFMQKQSAQ